MRLFKLDPRLRKTKLYECVIYVSNATEQEQLKNLFKYGTRTLTGSETEQTDGYARLAERVYVIS
ncbi:MAG: hypothetical protein IJZ26_03275 [Clostridia bacterium]|nr:hypothetical protein [Clostridia bacterium]